MNKWIFFIAVTACIVFITFLQPSFGAYVWVDDKGVTHMTDYPKPSHEPEQQEEKPGPSGVPAKKDIAPIEVKQAPDQAVSRTLVQPKTTELPVSAVTPSPADVQPIKAAVSVPTVTPPQQVGQTPVTSPSTSPQPIPPQAMPDPKQSPRGEQPMQSLAHKMPATIDPALMAGLGMKVLIVLAVLYLYGSLCLYLIARKLEVQAAWTAWIPIAQVWAFLRSAGKSLVWVLLLLVPLVNAVVGVYLWICITENLGKNKWLGLLMMIPIVNFIFLGILAFSAREA
jgi:Family of unknown function (DUF5684)